MLARSRSQITKQRRSFSAEFKHEAAELVLKQNYSYIEARRSLGVGELPLRRWVDHVHQERQGVTPKNKVLIPDQQKIQGLEARIARLEREKSILKKLPRSGCRKITNVRADQS